MRTRFDEATGRLVGMGEVACPIANGMPGRAKRLSHEPIALRTIAFAWQIVKRILDPNVHFFDSITNTYEKGIDRFVVAAGPLGYWVEFWQYENIDENPKIRDIRITVLSGGEKSLTIPIPGTDRFCCEEASLAKLSDGRLFTLLRSRAAPVLVPEPG